MSAIVLILINAVFSSTTEMNLLQQKQFESSRYIIEMQMQIKKINSDFNIYYSSCEGQITESAVLNCISQNTALIYKINRLNSYAISTKKIFDNLPKYLLSQKDRGIKISNEIIYFCETKLDALSTHLFEIKSIGLQQIQKKMISSFSEGVRQAQNSFYCDNFENIITLTKLKSDKFIKENSFPKVYQLHQYLQRVIKLSALAIEQCKNKIEMSKAQEIKLKLTTFMNENRVSEYLKLNCKKLASQSEKGQCLSQGIKKPELFFTLFKLNGEQI